SVWGLNTPRGFESRPLRQPAPERLPDPLSFDADEERDHMPQRSTGVWTGASQRGRVVSSAALTVIEQPAISSEVTYEPVRWRIARTPAPSSTLRAAFTIK